MPTLLEDIEAEYHAHLLTAGNLSSGKKAQKTLSTRIHAPAPLALVINWKFSANVAMVQMTTCTHCGSISKSLTGFFREEVGPSEARRWVNLSKDPAFSPHSQEFRVDLTPVSVAICPDCLPSPL
jgi:hypothetical protein